MWVSIEVSIEIFMGVLWVCLGITCVGGPKGLPPPARGKTGGGGAGLGGCLLPRMGGALPFLECHLPASFVLSSLSSIVALSRMLASVSGESSSA